MGGGTVMNTELSALWNVISTGNCQSDTAGRKEASPDHRQQDNESRKSKKRTEEHQLEEENQKMIHSIQKQRINDRNDLSRTAIEHFADLLEYLKSRGIDPEKVPAVAEILNEECRSFNRYTKDYDRLTDPYRLENF